MLAHHRSVPPNNHDAALIAASAAFRASLAALEDLSDQLEHDVACPAQIAALERALDQMLADMRQLAHRIIATPAHGGAGRVAKAAALHAHLQRTEWAESLETAWALSLADDELHLLVSNPPYDGCARHRSRALSSLLVGGALVAMVAAWRTAPGRPRMRRSAYGALASPHSQPAPSGWLLNPGDPLDA